MEVFRISRAKFASQLTASGVANRWNIDHQKVLYTGSSRSLATLELVVHKGAMSTNADFKVMVISIMDKQTFIHEVKINDLPDNWREIDAYPVLQQIGSDWYRNQTSLVLKVPSVIIPQEYNYVINTTHPDFNKNVLLAHLEDYFCDHRLV